MRTYCAVAPGGRVLDAFRAPTTLVENFEERVVRPAHVTTPSWYTSEVRFVDVTGVSPTPVLGFFRQPGGGWLDARPTLAVDKSTIKGDGVDAATVTFTQAGPATPSEVVFRVNGVDSPRVPVDADMASIEVTSASPGDSVTVTCGDLAVVINVEV
jgi:hypothetical protein